MNFQSLQGLEELTGLKTGPSQSVSHLTRNFCRQPARRELPGKALPRPSPRRAGPARRQPPAASHRGVRHRPSGALRPAARTPAPPGCSGATRAAPRGGGAAGQKPPPLPRRPRGRHLLRPAERDSR